MKLDFVFYHLALLGILILLTQSLALIWRANLFSLGHYGFFGIGAYAAFFYTRSLTHSADAWPLGQAQDRLLGFSIVIGSALAGGVAAGLAGYIAAWAFSRLRDDYLAVATLILAEIVQNVVANTPYLGGAIGVEVPYLFVTNSVQERFWYVFAFWMITAIANLILWLFICVSQKSVHGLHIAAIQDDPLAAEMSGVDVRQLQQASFTFGTCIAGVAGALFLHFTTSITPNDFSFLSGLPIILYVVLGRLNASQCIVAATVFYTVYELIKLRFFGIFGSTVGAAIANNQEIFFALVLVASVWLPGFLQFLLRQINSLNHVQDGQEALPFMRDRRLLLLAASKFTLVAAVPIKLATVLSKLQFCKSLPPFSRRLIYGANGVKINTTLLKPSEDMRPLCGKELYIQGVALDFNGLQALADINLQVRCGEVVGIIGPNGSGKTTLFNVITGVYCPNKGRVRFGEEDIAGKKRYCIARQGIARTFQSPRLFESLPMIPHTIVSMRDKASSPSGKGFLRSFLRHQTEANRILESIGLIPNNTPPLIFPTSMPYGNRRLLEMARCLAADPELVLLDEPTAGLSESESQDLCLVLQNQVIARGIGLLVIDHNIPFIRSFCPRLVVLDQGRIIRDGPTEEVLRDPIVVDAYLGQG
ncbi:MAG: ATP-binding cassette domain-containing protein [Abitibacteriaceae bacterium]|nr:ATP-binding cassette domain-containing protein [Abditibacteriaceae bacterium]